MYCSMQTRKLHEANPRFWFDWYTLQSREEPAICGGILPEGEWQAIFPKIYFNSTFEIITFFSTIFYSNFRLGHFISITKNTKYCQK